MFSGTPITGVKVDPGGGGGHEGPEHGGDRLNS